MSGNTRNGYQPETGMTVSYTHLLATVAVTEDGQPDVQIEVISMTIE